MFSGLEPLKILGVLALASTEPSAVCNMPKPTAINVIPNTAPVKYDLSRTRADIQNEQIDTINPYGFGSNSQVNGYMRGGIKTNQRIKLDYKRVLSNRAACIWYDEIELTIDIDPTIVIAKEVAADKCLFKAVKEHELKHVMADRKIVNKYSKSMGKKIYEGLKSRGFLVGPVPAKDAQKVANRMQETVGDLLKLEFKKMEIERSEAQQAIDSLEEYERVSNMCDRKTSASRSRSKRTYSR